MIGNKRKFIEMLILSEDDYERLTKGILIGVSIGVIIGVIGNNVPFFFALGGVSGIIGSILINCFKKLI